MNKDKKYNLLIFSILILGICALFYVQFATPTLYDADGYLHIRMARFLRDFGPRYNFHWARYSVFAEHFADKDFLYHVSLIPFTYFKDIFFGAKLAAAIFASFLFIVFYLIFRVYLDKLILPFGLLAFFFSDLFLQAVSMPRPISIVILVGLVSVYLTIKRRYLWIYLIALFYSLVHVTAFLLIFYAFIVKIIRYIDNREFCVKTIIFGFLGILTGFIIHPNFPNNLYVFYLNSVLFPIYTIKTGVLEIGAEMFPINTRDYLLSYPVIIIGIILFVFTSIYRRPKTRFETKAFLALSTVYFVLSFICQRYIVHGYPFMLLAFTSYISDSVKDRELEATKKVKTILLIVIVLLGINTYKAVRYNALVTRIYNTHYEQVGKWMEKNIPEGELVFHSNWSDGQYFIGLNPKNDYFVAIDPIYMYEWNHELYQLYRDVSFGRTSDPYTILKNTFKVRYGYIGKNYFTGLINQIRQDTRFKILAEDNFGVIFKLI
jgi:hypothetical protein